MQRAHPAVNPPMAPENPYDIASYPLLVVVSGPSGVGKDTLLQRLKDVGSDFWFVVTMTSRAQRPGEVDGKDYFFVTREEFDDLIEADELLEHSLVYGEYKGIPKEQVRKALSTGKNVVMRIDVQGAAKIKRIVPQAVTIFLMPESEEELIRRLRRDGPAARVRFRRGQPRLSDERRGGRHRRHHARGALPRWAPAHSHLGADPCATFRQSARCGPM